jgi:hypothetical protein
MMFPGNFTIQQDRLLIDQGTTDYMFAYCEFVLAKKV